VLPVPDGTLDAAHALGFEEIEQMNALPKRIVLATDGSEDATLAARAAVELSNRMSADLYVAHAWRFVPPYADYPRVEWGDYVHLYEREARRVLESQLEAIEGMGGTIAESRLLRNPPIDAILDLCEEVEPDLLVMGSRGLGTVRRILVGSVSEGVVHHARCPVLVVRGESEAWPPERVVVGEDGSDDAGRAAELAAGIARHFGAGIVLVRAYQNPPKPVGGWSAEDGRKLDEVLFRQEGGMKERAKEFEEVLGSYPEIRVIEGEAAAAILDVAGDGSGRMTLVAVGSRGLGMIGRARLGSVSTKVLGASPRPVLVCPRTRR